jgi:hypothetical protein
MLAARSAVPTRVWRCRGRGGSARRARIGGLRRADDGVERRLALDAIVEFELEPRYA